MRGWLPAERRALPLLLIVSLLTSCGGSFASKLRSVLNLAPPLIDSLVSSGVIKPELRQSYIQDFQDLADGAATLGEGLNACHDNACKLDAVERFQQRFWDVQRRGHFGTSPKLRNIEALLSAIILAAKAYYSPPSRSGAQVTEADIRIKIEQLRAEMKP